MTWAETRPMGLPQAVYEAPSAAIVGGFKCNCSCSFCVLGEQGRNEETSREFKRGKQKGQIAAPLGAREFVAFYEAMVRHGARSINNQGVDPFGGDRISKETSWALLEATKRHGHVFSFVSSFEGVDDDVVAAVAAHPHAYAYASVDDVDEHHDNIRGVRALFEHVDDMLVRMLRAGMQERASVTSVMLADENNDRLYRILDWLKDIGIKRWAINPELLGGNMTTALAGIGAKTHLHPAEPIETVCRRFMDIRVAARKVGITVFMTSEFDHMLQGRLPVDAYNHTLFGKHLFMRLRSSGACSIGKNVMGLSLTDTAWIPDEDDLEESAHAFVTRVKQLYMH